MNLTNIILIINVIEIFFFLRKNIIEVDTSIYEHIYSKIRITPNVIQSYGPKLHLANKDACTISSW